MRCDNSGWNEEREVDWNVLVLVNLSFVLMCHIPKKKTLIKCFQPSVSAVSSVPVALSRLLKISQLYLS